MKYGCDTGSTIFITEKNYMTNKAWILVAIALVKGYRDMDYLKENPEWFFSEMLDGFGFHKRVLDAHRRCKEAR